MLGRIRLMPVLVPIRNAADHCLAGCSAEAYVISRPRFDFYFFNARDMPIMPMSLKGMESPMSWISLYSHPVKIGRIPIVAA